MPSQTNLLCLLSRPARNGSLLLAREGTGTRSWGGEYCCPNSRGRSYPCHTEASCQCLRLRQLWSSVRRRARPMTSLLLQHVQASCGGWSRSSWQCQHKRSREREAGFLLSLDRRGHRLVRLYSSDASDNSVCACVHASMCGVCVQENAEVDSTHTSRCS